jgi:transketolase
MRRALVRTITELAKTDPRIVLLTADLGFMVLEEFADAHPDRFYNVGVAEANMVGLATGLASCGYLPFVYSIATFATMRCYEQIRNGPVLHGLPVRIVGVGGGFEYGHGGLTHHALEDLAIARVQPNLTVVAPADHEQAAAALRETYALSGPVYYRMGKRDDYVLPGLNGRFRLGRLETVREGGDLLILSLGSISAEVAVAVDRLEQRGITVTWGVVSSLRPAPAADILSLLRCFSSVLTVEEHYRDGGLGSMVCELAAEEGLPIRVRRCGVTAVPGMCGGERYLRDEAGLSGERLFHAAMEALQADPLYEASFYAEPQPVRTGMVNSMPRRNP